MTARAETVLFREKFIDWPDHNVDYTQDFVKQPISGSFTDLSEVRRQLQAKLFTRRFMDEIFHVLFPFLSNNCAFMTFFNLSTSQLTSPKGFLFVNCLSYNFQNYFSAILFNGKEKFSYKLNSRLSANSYLGINILWKARFFSLPRSIYGQKVIVWRIAIFLLIFHTISINNWSTVMAQNYLWNNIKRFSLIFSTN